MIENKREYGLLDNYLHSLPFASGALVLLGWFFWQGRTVSDYQLEEWLIFYSIALLSWQPIAAWLTAEALWVPAAELFFLLHIPYYVAPFVRGDEKFVALEPG